MRIVYVYVLDTLADWELGNITAELKSKRFFKTDAEPIELKTVGLTKDPVQTMGGMEVRPECTVDDMVVDEKNVLILPGANTWDSPAQMTVVEKAKKFLAVGATVCAICGATVALANAGLLDNRPHTSNGPGFLEMSSPRYRGRDFYVDKPSVADANLITAACTGSLLWAKLIIARVGVFKPETLEAWYAYFSTGKPECFFALMQTLKD